ncbi:MAG: RIP metalloprotease RseP [Clostridiales bacterium]|nr:RIP metalloprotease RseP [Clostridiales bacterium]
MARFLYILLAILLFGVLIAIHEFGHFFTAKLLGVKVNEFAIGMGPALWSKQKGETLYALRAFPVGGYCAMEGEDEDTGDPRAFSCQAGWKKIIILCAGAFMNFVLGLVITVALFLGVTQARAPVITEFADGFQLQGADGVMAGDRVVQVDGHGIWVYADVQTYLSRNDGNGVDLVVERDGERVELNDFPMGRYDYEFENGRYHGFGLIFGQVDELSIPERIGQGVAQTFDFVRIVWMSLGDLVTGRVAVSELSGVIGVVDVVSEVGSQSETVAMGVQNVFYFMALIAVNLAVMNMLPIPALDGGRIFFVLLNGLIYLVARRRIPERFEGYVHAGAFVLLLALMAVVALHDVWNIFA